MSRINGNCQVCNLLQTRIFQFFELLLDEQHKRKLFVQCRFQSGGILDCDSDFFVFQAFQCVYSVQFSAQFFAAYVTNLGAST